MKEVMLGPFSLIDPIGQGGMGQVWRAVHRAQHLPVAVKILNGQSGMESRFLAAFRNEVRSVAGLDHPHVVRLLDYGTVPEEAARSAEGRLIAGSPYLVTELLTGGSLRRQVGRPMPWAATREILLCLLDALAHAHARGVIHLDLKPDNVLFGAPGDARPGLKLTDFGLAQAFAHQEGDERVLFAGTPLFMAPEQFADRWRDYGPWTDLYALGILAYLLLTGGPPWQDTEYGALQQAHLWADPPPLNLRQAAPAGIERWVRRLLEKDPGRRYSRAADAAWALLSLGEAPELIVEGEAADPALVALNMGSQATAIQALLSLTTTASRGEESSGDDWLVMPYDAPVRGSDTTTSELEENLEDEVTRQVFPSAPPMPADWGAPAPPAPSLRLACAGLNLYWLRALPIVDREAERDALWDALWEVRELRQARAVVLRGPHGVGKSRLAEWLCERAHEVGAASWVKATHSEAGSPSDGLGPMMARRLRCTNLTRAHVESRLRGLLPRMGLTMTDHVLALTELILPATEAERQAGLVAYAFSNPLERYAVIRRVLDQICAERPLILWLDDAQWGADALRLAWYLMDDRRRVSLPVLVVVTGRDDALASRPDEARIIDEIGRHHGTTTVSVGPLPPEHRGALVRELLGVEPALASQVADWTGGNPLFAVQLVGEWVERGLLTLGESGFRLQNQGEAELNVRLPEVWARRLDRALEGRPPEEAEALELAAVLGQDVNAAEWDDLCSLAGLPTPWELMERMLAERLAITAERHSELGWSFVHSMLRELLESRARVAGRLVHHHALAAELLSGRQSFGAAERQGRHLVAAGAPQDAIDPLLQGATERHGAGDLALAEALLEEREQIMRDVDLPENDARWGAGWVLHARVAGVRLRRDVAEAHILKAEGAARRYGWPLVLVLALRERSRMANTVGDHSRGILWAREAEQVAVGLEDRLLLARCRMEVGDLLVSLGILDAAEESYRLALPDLESWGSEVDVATAHRALALASFQGGHVAEAEPELQRALETYERRGLRSAIGFCRNLLGDIGRAKGDFAMAEHSYQQSIACYRAVESSEVVIPTINLGLGYSDQGRFSEARPVLEEGLEAIQAQGRRGIEGCVRVGLLPSLAAQGDWSAFDAHFRQGRQLIDETGFVENDIARMAEQAGELCLLEGEAERAQRVLAIAEAQYQALDRADDAQRVRDRAAGLAG